MTYKEVALAVLEDVRTEINEVIIRYGVRSELLDNGAVFYMNGNDGTDFDYQCNGHLCEFYTFYKNNKGFCKLLLNVDGSADIYIYLDGADSPTEMYTVENLSVEDETRFLACLLYYAADSKGKWDENVENIDFNIDVSDSRFDYFPDVL